MDCPETEQTAIMTKTTTGKQNKRKQKNVPLAEPEDDDVDVLIEDSGIICDEGLLNEGKEAAQDEDNEATVAVLDDTVFTDDPAGATSSGGGTPKKKKGKGALEVDEGSRESVANVVYAKEMSSTPSEPTVIQMNGDLDMSLEQIMDVNGNGTGKSKKWFEQKIAELENLEKTSVVAVDGGSSGSDRMTDLDSLAPGLEIIDFAEKYFNVHATGSGYTRSAISKTVSMVRRRSLSVSMILMRKIICEMKTLKTNF